MKTVRFGYQKQNDFYATVKKRVDEFFSLEQKTKHANLKMMLKIAIILSLYVLSYGMIVSGTASPIGLLGWFSLLGLMIGMLGFNLSHDVLHGAFFSSPRWNRILSYFFDFNGTSSFVWKVSHNLHHHIYTNIPGHDKDIDKAILLRLSPKDKIYPFHRFQHLYAPILYLFTSINWMYYSDFKWFLTQKNIPKREKLLFYIFKSIHLFVFLGIPLLFVDAPFWLIILGFLLLHFSGGFFIALIFQLAHIVENVQFPFTDEKGEIEDAWAEHEMKTTSNFATKSPLWCYLFGGLNFQIEHHLFSHICHIHYADISKIVKETANEFSLPYFEQPTLRAAIRSHFATLRRFGVSE